MILVNSQNIAGLHSPFVLKHITGLRVLAHRIRAPPTQIN